MKLLIDLTVIFLIVIKKVVPPLGIEPSSSVLQTGAMTTSAKVTCLGCLMGNDPILPISQNGVQTTTLKTPSIEFVSSCVPLIATIFPCNASRPGQDKSLGILVQLATFCPWTLRAQVGVEPINLLL